MPGHPASSPTHTAPLHLSTPWRPARCRPTWVRSLPRTTAAGRTASRTAHAARPSAPRPSNGPGVAPRRARCQRPGLNRPGARTARRSTPATGSGIPGAVIGDGEVGALAVTPAVDIDGAGLWRVLGGVLEQVAEQPLQQLPKEAMRQQRLVLEVGREACAAETWAGASATTSCMSSAQLERCQLGRLTG